MQHYRRSITNLIRAEVSRHVPPESILDVQLVQPDALHLTIVLRASVGLEGGAMLALGRRPAPEGIGLSLGAVVAWYAVAKVLEGADAAVFAGVGADDDSLRARLIPAALGHLHQAIADGVPVFGYCHWSLLDNFEWIFGYGPKFGLASVDRTTFERTPKPSSVVYEAIARSNAL